MPKDRTITKIDHVTLNDPVVIRYREDGKVKMVMVDTVSASCQGGSKNYTWHLRSLDGSEVKVLEAHIPKSEMPLLRYLYHRYYLRRLLNMSLVSLTTWENYERDIDGLPDGTIEVLGVNDELHRWLIHTKSGVTLHLESGGEFHEEGELHHALRRMFPQQGIEIRRTVRKVVVEVVAKRPVQSIANPLLTNGQTRGILEE